MGFNVGDILRDNDDLFVEAFEETVKVRNYVEPAASSGVDEYLDPNGSTEDGDTDPHPSNPVTTTAQIDPFFGESVGTEYGADVDADFMIHIPEGVDVVGADGGTASDGAELIAPSEIERVEDGSVFQPSHVYLLDNGRQKVFARRVQ